jgi:hypothetical protein
MLAKLSSRRVNQRLRRIGIKSVRGRKGTLVPAAVAFKEFEKEGLRAAWEVRESVRLFAEKETRAEAEKEEEAAKAPPAPGPLELAALTGAGRARAWHLRECAEFARARGLGKRAGWAAWCAALAAGGIEAPDWVSQSGVVPGGWKTLENWERKAKAGPAGLDARYAGRASRHFADHPGQRREALGLLFARPGAGARWIAEALRARHGAAGPSESAVRRALARNLGEFASKRMTAFGSMSADVTRLNQRWEVDSTLVDALLKGETKRRCLLQVVDVYSGRRLFMLALTSNAKAIGRLLLRAIREWGVPEEVKTDNGKDYVGRLLTGFFRSLGIKHVRCQFRRGDQKPHVEKGFGDFQRDFVEKLPGFVGHSVEEIQEIRARGGTGAGVSLEEFNELLEKWMDRDYHRKRSNSGRLKGKSPADMVAAWATAPGNEVRRVKDEGLLGFLLSVPEPRTVGKDGIRYDNRDFIAPELAPGREVTVRESPEDAGRLAVFERGEGGAFICMAVDAEAEGVDRAEIAARARNRQKAGVAAMREFQREAKKFARPAEAVRDVLDARGTSNVIAFERTGYIDGTPAMAAAVAAAVADRTAGALRAKAERLAAKVAQGAGGAAVAVFEPAPAQLDAAAMEAASRLFDASGAAAPDAETWEEPPDARFIRILRHGPSLPGDREFHDYYCQLPEGRGMLLALALPDAATAAC